MGISACLVIYLLVSFELSYDNFHPDREQVYRITSGFKNADGSTQRNSGLSELIPATGRKELTGIEKVAATPSL